MAFLQKLSLLLAFCVLLQTLSPAPNLSVMMMVAAKDPSPRNITDVQIKLEVELELSEQRMDEANQEMTPDLAKVKENFDIVNSASELNIADAVKQLSSKKIMVKIASSLGKALTLLNAASAIAGFILSFLLPSELDMITELINKRFDEVNRKLDGLSNKLDLMETSIKASIAFNTFLSTYIEWEYAIRNGAEKLKAVMMEMRRTRDKRLLLKMVSEYTTYYNDNQLEGKMLNLYRVTVTANNPTNRNLFDLFNEEHSCDITQLSGLMIVLKGLMTSAAQQTLTYYYFKGEDARAKSSFETIKMYLFQMRQEFQKRVYFCKQNTIGNAKKEVDNILEKNTRLLPEVLVQFISKRLTNLYPWYAWGAAGFKEIGPPTCKPHLINKGVQYFTKEKNDKQMTNILVTWQDLNDRLSCPDIKRVRTLVPYQRCDTCNNDHVSASQNILTEKKCPGSLNLQCIKPIFFAKAVTNWDWIAVDAMARKDTCREQQVCNGHGNCHPVPDTNQFMCICHPKYDGETCEKEMIFNNEISKHLAALRAEFMTVNGVPTVVDIYFELQNGLKTNLKSIKNAIAHTQALIKHSDILYKASYIAQLFIDLRHGQKSLAIFGQFMEKFLTLNSENYILFRLKGILLGEGIAELKGDDFFNTFKKNYVSNNNNACTETYYTVVSNLKKNLVFLDEAVGEALLMWKLWKIKTGDRSAIASLETFTRDFKTRQGSYHNHWKSTSCPSLTVPDLIQSFCTDSLSYENMQVQLSCSDHKVPSPSSVQCVRRNGKLVWSTIPSCNYQWAGWGSWSACSVTCGDGKQYRTRVCIGHETRLCGSVSRQEKVCQKTKCCLSRDGNYQCSNGRCISKSQFCDGNNNCGNGEDESRSKCPKMIRSGDTIALKGFCTKNHWLSCYCLLWTVFYKCLVQPCPGSEIHSDKWNSCKDEIFHIKSVRHDENSAIHHGDEIGIHSRVMDSWLSCPYNGQLCATRSCPGKLRGTNFHGCTWERFFIFSAPKMGGCSSCRGKPLEHGDVVYIQSSSSRAYWLSDDGGSVRTRTCPGRSINRYTGCRCERWQIHKN